MAEIIPITDFQAPELDIYARCSESQLLHYYEPNGGIFIAESPKVIERALNMGCEPISLLAETKHPDTKLAGIISRCPDIPVYTAPYEILTKLTGFALTRGALCAMRRPALRSVEELCRKTNRHPGGRCKSNECRRYYPIGCSTPHGCSPSDTCLQ